MLVDSIQHQLHSIYDLQLDHRVRDFLITSQQQASSLETATAKRSTNEKLLVCQDNDELGVSLFIDEEVLDSLSRNDPFKNLNQENLATFCTALEGVSHFVYLSWNAHHDRPISQLELELQAEVDKFIAIAYLSRVQGKPVAMHELSDWLFNSCRFDPELNPGELDRYQSANAYAAQFCARLHKYFPQSDIDQIAYKELRRFYRMRHMEKLNECSGSGEIPGP